MDGATPESRLSAAGAQVEYFSAGPDTEGRQPKEEPPSFTMVNPTTLLHTPVPERHWIVQDWLPVGHVTLLYGDGGTGKTLLAQQLMTSTAVGASWCGLAVEQCRVLGIFAEDDADELHRRQHAINEHMGISFADLADMRWHSGVGQDNLLITFDRNGMHAATEQFEQIKQAAKEFGARLVVIDTAADTFGGNENDRAQVRQFIGHVLNELAQFINGAVLLNAHPSRTGLASGNLDGGSTAWSNSARSRWSLERAANEDGPSNADVRILTRRKANYASIGDTIKLTWQRGVLVPQERLSPLAAAVRQQSTEELFLTLLDRCEASDLPLSNSPNATNFAPKRLAGRPDANETTRQEFHRAMESLFATGVIKRANYGRKGDPRWKIVRSDVGQNRTTE